MEKKYCFIISSMRSGSTLLKALIATRPDCTHIPEKDFKEYDSVKSDKKIIVLKRPCGYWNFDYPELAETDSKKIILIRNPYDTVCSLKEMNLKMNRSQQFLNNELYLISYWCMVYKNIIEKKILENGDALLVRYEDLIRRPLEQTERIFKFIGSQYCSGTDQYAAPEDYQWEWGKDDGGDVIKTLMICKHKRRRSNRSLINFINNTPEVQSTLSYFGYGHQHK